MCEIGTRKRPHFQQEGGPFFCRILHPPLIPGRHPADAGTRSFIEKSERHFLIFAGHMQGFLSTFGFPVKSSKQKIFLV